MSSIIAFLLGKKTYIVAGVTILYAVTQHWTGVLTFDQMIQMILAALGLSALRAGVAKGA